MTEEIIYLAGGCFWGIEKMIRLIPGVMDTQVGYANGAAPTATYQQVCAGSGHAEAVRVRFDRERLSLDTLLSFFFDVIDPTSVNRQGGDSGVQYRTGVYYVHPAQQPVIEAALAGLQTKYDRPLATEALPLTQYCPAEEYHQAYLDKNPGGYCHIGIADFVRLAAKIKQL